MSLLTTLGVDQYLILDRSSGESGFLTDVMGSTVAMTDAMGGLQAEYTYEPFGTAAVTSTTADAAFTFTGRENDATGLYYYRARYYDAARQRFVNEDPLGLLAGVNVYAYVLNNPIRYVDPFGLDILVVLYYGQNGNPFGHIGVGVYTPALRTSGFNPVPNPYAEIPSGFGFVPIPGFVGIDTNEPHEILRIDTTGRPEADLQVQKAIAQWIANPGLYQLTGRNCTTFVADVLRAAGIQAPNTGPLPESLMNYLRQKYGVGGF